MLILEVRIFYKVPLITISVAYVGVLWRWRPLPILSLFLRWGGFFEVRRSIPRVTTHDELSSILGIEVQYNEFDSRKKKKKKR